MCERNDNIVRYAEANGTLAPFVRAYVAVHGSEPENALAAFEGFVRNMTHVLPAGVHRSIFEYFKKRYNGGVQRFYVGNGIAMVLYRRRAVAFFPSIALRSGSLKANNHQNSNPPPTQSFRGAETPRHAGIFRAALASQLPSRGRPTPNGKI